MVGSKIGPLTSTFKLAGFNILRFPKQSRQTKLTPSWTAQISRLESDSET